MVLTPVTPATWEVATKRIIAQASISWAQWHTPVVPATWEAVGRRIAVQGCLQDKKQKIPPEKLAKQKKARIVSQMIECLPSKCERPYVQTPVAHKKS
jgi:hypothetical protein